MSFSPRILFSLAIVCLATGCEIDRVLTIKPDGSGQIHERFLASKDSYMHKEPPRAANDNTPITLTPGIEPPSAAFIAKRAAEFGEGVDLASFKKIETEDMMGYEADYTFADVTKIRADTFLQQSSDAGSSPDQTTPADPSRNFQFTKGAVSELRVPVKFAQGKTDTAAKAAEPPKEDPKQRDAFFEAIKHLDMRMAIRVQGKIEETNSHFRRDNEVIVSEMNVKGLVADPKHAQEFKDAASGKTSPKEPPKDDRYIKDETVDVLTIRFR